MSAVFFVFIILALAMYSQKKGVGKNKALSNFYMVRQRFGVFFIGLFFFIFLGLTVYKLTQKPDPESNMPPITSKQKIFLLVVTTGLGLLFALSIWWLQTVKKWPTKQRANLQKVDMFFDATDVIGGIWKQ
tara:strand:+ start:724 stop:1116 length:393 start_codon:yes stop_codon:yes gene_type:complete